MFVKIIGPASDLGDFLANEKLCDLWIWFSTTEEAIAFELDLKNRLADIVLIDRLPLIFVEVLLHAFRINHQRLGKSPCHSIWINELSGTPEQVRPVDYPTVISAPADFKKDARSIFELLNMVPARARHVVEEDSMQQRVAPRGK